jgi:hypothetical protein
LLGSPQCQNRQFKKQGLKFRRFRRFRRFSIFIKRHHDRQGSRVTLADVNDEILGEALTLARRNAVEKAAGRGKGTKRR